MVFFSSILFSIFVAAAESGLRQLRIDQNEHRLGAQRSSRELQRLNINHPQPCQLNYIRINSLGFSL